MLLDADVLLDVALNRVPFVEASVAVCDRCQEIPGSTILAWHTFSNVYYLLRAAQNDQKARRFLADILQFSEVATAGTLAVRQALALPMSDFEDALQVTAAVAADVQLIITRNMSDYRRSPLPAMTPSAFLRRYAER